MFGQYSLASLRRGLQKPHLLPLEFNRLVHTRGRRWSHNRNGTNIFERDWDSLLVLDACRYDTFAETHSLPGSLRKAQSVGANTHEWLRGTLDGREFHDTIYVTSNPQLYRINNGIYEDTPPIDVSFYDTVEVWQDGWDEDIRTVRPETVAEAAREALAENPNKRLLVHFIQPHYPFIGPTGREHFDLDHLNFNWENHADVSAEVMRQAYRENLEIALPVVADLLDDLDGKTVVTADHGEAFGERDWPLPAKLFAHRLGHYADVLVDVPWLCYQNGDRRTIRADEPAGPDHGVDDDVVEQRLADLGYR